MASTYDLAQQQQLTDFFRHCGVAVKNTFIDFPQAPAQVRRRSSSVPPCRGEAHYSSTYLNNVVELMEDNRTSQGLQILCNRLDHDVANDRYKCSKESETEMATRMYHSIPKGLELLSKKLDNDWADCKCSTESETEITTQVPSPSRSASPESRHTDSEGYSAEDSSPTWLTHFYKSVSDVEAQVGAGAVNHLMQDVAKAIFQDMGILDITSCRVVLQSRSRPNRKKASRHGGLNVVLCFFLRNLPQTKRAKWHQPLLLAFATVLVRNGFLIVAEHDQGRLTVIPASGPRFNVDVAVDSA